MKDSLFRLSNDLILSKFHKEEEVNELSLKIFFKCIHTLKENQQDFFFNEVYVGDLVKSNNYNEIKKSVMNLKRQTLNLIDNEKKKHYEVVDIFERKLIYNNGYLSFKFTEDILPYIINLKNNYTLVDIENLIKLNSIHSIRLYLLLKKDIYYNKKNYLVEDLYNYLNLKDVYREFKHFKKRILVKAIQDIEDNTTLNIKEVVLNKVGRKVNNIIFEREEKEIDIYSFINFLRSEFKHKVLMTHKPTKTEYYINEKGLLTKDSLVMDKEESMKIYKYLYNHKEVYLKQIEGVE